MVEELPRDLLERPVAVLGAGTLGRRIALMMASAGGTVRIYDLSAEAALAAKAYVDAELPALVRTRGEGATIGTVETSNQLGEAVDGVWLVVEAVPEKLELKRKIFAELSELAPADAILASNSSSYASREFVDGVADRSRVLNMHFYMPPRQCAVDLMSCGETSEAVIAFLRRELPRYGVFPFVAHAESTGFIFNRIWAAIKREALAVVADGVSTPEDVDAMYKINTGAAAGVFEMMDRVGLDVVLDIEQHYAQEFPHLPEGPRRVLHEKVDAGHLGVKTGRGFFAYDAEGRRIEEAH